MIYWTRNARDNVDSKNDSNFGIWIRFSRTPLTNRVGLSLQKNNELNAYWVSIVYKTCLYVFEWDIWIFFHVLSDKTNYMKIKKIKYSAQKKMNLWFDWCDVLQMVCCIMHIERSCVTVATTKRTLKWNANVTQIVKKIMQTHTHTHSKSKQYQDKEIFKMYTIRCITL